MGWIVAAVEFLVTVHVGVAALFVSGAADVEAEERAARERAER